MPITPPPSSSPVGTAGAVPGGAVPQLQVLGEVVVEVVPERLALLSRMILLSGMVTEQKQGGALVLRTQLGDLTIRSQTPLPLDKVLTLQIPPGAPPVRAQVSVMPSPLTPHPLPHPSAPPVATSLSHSPLAQAIVAQQTATPKAPLPTSSLVTHAVTQGGAQGVTHEPPPLLSAAASSATFATLSALPLLPGSVVAAKIMALPTPMFLPSLPEPMATPGTTQSVPLAHLSTLPALESLIEVVSKGAPALQALLPQNLAEVVAHLPPAVLNPIRFEAVVMPPAPNIPAAPAFSSLPVMLTLPPGSAVTVQVERIILPDGTEPVVPHLAPQPALLNAPKSEVPVLPAVVIGTTPKAEPIVTSPAGILVLEDQAPIPVGTKVEVSLVHVAEPALEEELPLPAKPRDWPVLQQVMAQLPGLIPAAVQPHVTKPEHVGSQMLFLLAALGFKDPKALVGEEVARTVPETLLTRLAGEMQQISQTWTKPPETPPTEWRSLALPLPMQGEVQRLAVHTRHEEREGEGGAGGASKVGRRLVIEVEMSRLGAMLLDGFILQKRFDVTLRSQRRLSQTLCGELRSAFGTALSGMNWTGELTFQTAADLWLKSPG